jgi:hypothetical protein
MLVFIDESGDPGFKVDRGSSPVFAVAMVIFADGRSAGQTERIIRATQLRFRVKPEFKFAKASDKVRDGFFAAVCRSPFMVRAIVVRKEVIYSSHLRADKEAFYRFVVRQIMTFDGGELDQARVVIDGSGDRAFKRRLGSALRRPVGENLREVRFSDSRSDPLLQLADMCAGAIACSYRADSGHDPWRWSRMLHQRIRDIWHLE